MSASASAKRIWSIPAHKERMSAAQKKLWQIPEIRDRRMAGLARSAKAKRLPIPEEARPRYTYLRRCGVSREEAIRECGA